MSTAMGQIDIVLMAHVSVTGGHYPV